MEKMTAAILKKLKTAAVMAAFLLAAYTALAGLIRARGTEPEKETEAAALADGDISFLFPDERSKETMLRNECGSFTDFFSEKIRENDAEPLYGLLAKDALLERDGHLPDREEFSELVSRLSERMGEAELKMTAVTVLGGKSGTSSAAVIRADFMERAGTGEEEFARTSAAPLFIYVYAGSAGHIESFFLYVQEGSMRERGEDRK